LNGALAPLVWGLLQPVSCFSSAPALEHVFSVACGRRSRAGIPSWYLLPYLYTL